jgi:rhodanese-related sulfurtransferase
LVSSLKPAHVPSIDVGALPADATIVDVREDDEWSAGHVSGASHVPMHAVASRLAEIPSDRDIVIVCRRGSRSAQVTSYLNGVGYRAVNLTGGMQAWAASGRPMVSDSGEPPEVI